MLNFKNPHLKNISKLLNLLTILVLVFTFYKTLHAIFYVVYATFTNKTLELNGLEHTLYTIFPIHAALLMVPLYLMIFSFTKKNFSFWFLGASLAGGFILPSYEWFDKFIHPLLFKTHIFDYFLRPGQLELNPQYTKIFFFLVFLIILFILNLRKKTRSADRIFVLLISGAVLTTTMIFHIAIPMGYFKYAKYQLDQNLGEQVSYMPKDILCKNRNCFDLDNNLSLVSMTPGSHPQLLHTYSYFIDGSQKYFNYTHATGSFTSALGNFEGQRFDYVISAMKKTDNGYFVIMDENIAKKFSRNSEIWFSFLAVCAHAFWIYGAMGLLFLHKKRFFRKLSPRTHNSLNTKPKDIEENKVL